MDKQLSSVNKPWIKSYPSHINWSTKLHVSSIFDGLKKSTPKSIRKPGIISRINVLETKFLILEAHYSSNEMDKKLEKNRINDIISANSNFIYQIDKLIERSNQIIEN